MTGSRAAGQGALAGLAGGLVFGAAMAKLGVLPTIAALVRVDSPTVGFVVHMSVAAAVGAIFGMLVRHQNPGAGETVFWGLAYGMFWWYLGALTLLPALLGHPVGWNTAVAQAAFPSLLGHLLYGATTGLVLAWLRRRDPAAQRPPLTGGVVARGTVAGVAATWLLTATVGETNQPLAVAQSMAHQPLAVVAVA